MESNPPTPLVTRHNGFEVRSYSYQCVRLGPLTWEIRRGLYQCVRLVGSSGRKFSHFFSHLLGLERGGRTDRRFFTRILN